MHRVPVPVSLALVSFAPVVLLACGADRVPPSAPAAGDHAPIVPTVAQPITLLPVELRPITAGAFHSCGIADDGRAFCWGLNTSGQLGYGFVGDPPAPNATGFAHAVVGGLTFAAITAGRAHTCALTPQGAVYCWGAGYGSAPVPAAPGATFSVIEAMQDETCGLTAFHGQVYCWAGVFSTGASPLFGGQRFTAMSAGQAGVCAITPEGEVLCNFGEPRPTAAIGERFVAVSVGAALSGVATHACALTVTGAAYCWGPNGFGQLGTGLTPLQLPFSLAAVRVATDVRFTAISAGKFYTCALDPIGMAYCWGSPEAFGRSTDATPVLVPTLLTDRFALGSIDAMSVFNGTEGHTCGVTTGALGVCWGNAGFGRLGNGNVFDDYFGPGLVQPAIAFATPTPDDP